MHNLILSSCGTSLLTNGAPPDEFSELKRLANKKESELSQKEKDFIDHVLSIREKALVGAEPKDVRRLSAELNGIIAWYGPDSFFTGFHKGDVHFLVSSDTYQGEKAAAVIEEWLRLKGCNAHVNKIRDLDTSSLENFHMGLSELARWCAETLPGYRNPKWHVVFNLTGGFKGMNGFLQAAGMFYADEIVYIFETGNELLRIPRLPISLETEEIIEKHLMAFRRLALGEELPKGGARGIETLFLMEHEGRVGFSPWGELIWSEWKSRHYGERLFEPLGEKLVYSARFRKAVGKLPPERRVILNRRVDDLFCYLEKGINPNSLSFKPLQGTTRLPSTHECRAWSDRDAGRIYGHFEGDKFMVDDLNAHL